MRSKEAIRAGLLRTAARIWGYQETEMDVEAFDPMVKILLGACAKEFEKIEREIDQSNVRILDHLIGLLTPDIDVGVLPAHAIAHARSITPQFFLKTENQLFGTKRYEDGTQQEVFFSPVNQYQVVNAGIKYIANGGNLLQVENFPLNENLVEDTSKVSPFPNGSLWFGIEIAPEVKQLDQLQFFFNWKNEPDLDTYLSLIGLGQWFIGENKRLTFSKGYLRKRRNSYQGVKSPFEVEYSPTLRLCRDVESYYKNHFWIVGGFQNTGKNIQDHKKHHPKCFEEVFTNEDLQKIDGQLVWINFQLPEFFPQAAWEKMETHLNCFPVVNRRFHSRNYSLEEHINVLPLICEDLFFDIQNVTNSSNVEYNQSALSNIRNYESGQYSIRRKGVGKFSSDDASQMLYELIDRIRDEVATFDAYQTNILSTSINRIKAELAKLQSQVNQDNEPRQGTSYITIKPLKTDDELMINYWSTIGGNGNDIPANAPMEMYRFTSLYRNTIKLMTSTIGGHDELTSQQKKHVYKKALISRERVVTQEDIKAFCWARLGESILDINLKKGFKIGEKPSEGMIRTLDVYIDLINSNDEKEDAARKLTLFELERELNMKSSYILPIIVKNVQYELAEE